MDPEEFAKQILEHFGCSVQKIPETNQPTPDFLVTLGEQQYLVELKTKRPNREQIERRNATLDAGELYEEFEPVLRRNLLSGIVRDATGQLKDHDQGGIFRLAWFMATGHNASARMHQFAATLYGSTTLVDWSEKGTAADCYYFYNSDFHRYKEHLDGALVSTQCELKFCLNTYSPRYEQLRESSLAQALGQGVCDPTKREADGVAYIMDGDVDRADKEAVLAYLRLKYEQEKITDMTMSHISATTAVPRKES